ncbi:MAG: GNAT family N-acetyltransferase [Colwelliaceae bacterium]|nr:GNAT family N-acetyltransferase [Colwelliaceae bacterium]
MRFQIRAASKGDSLQLSDLMAEHARYEGCELIIQSQFSVLQDLKNTPLHIFVVEQNHHLVGYMSLVKQYSTWDMDWYLYLDCLYLQKSARGKGQGRQLMERALVLSESLKIKLIQWQTPIDNKNAISFYHQLGAKSKTKQRFYWSNRKLKN